MLLYLSSWKENSHFTPLLPLPAALFHFGIQSDLSLFFFNWIYTYQNHQRPPPAVKVGNSQYSSYWISQQQGASLKHFSYLSSKTHTPLVLLVAHCIPSQPPLLVSSHFPKWWTPRRKLWPSFCLSFYLSEPCPWVLKLLECWPLQNLYQMYTLRTNLPPNNQSCISSCLLNTSPLKSDRLLKPSHSSNQSHKLLPQSVSLSSFPS